MPGIRDAAPYWSWPAETWQQVHDRAVEFGASDPKWWTNVGSRVAAQAKWHLTRLGKEVRDAA
jgi:hypothetical protein